MSQCSNSASWGHYADSHKGVALIFKPSIFESEPVLYQCQKSSISSSEPPLPFKKITYTEQINDISFFQNMGKESPIDLMKNWYLNETHIDPYGLPALNPSNRRNYMNFYRDNIHQKLLEKTEDWAYESEYRLFFEDTNNYEKIIHPARRVISYHFSSLHGIIFGANTSEKDKEAIRAIIQEKCEKEGRESFTFYQAYFSKEKNCICWA